MADPGVLAVLRRRGDHDVVEQIGRMVPVRTEHVSLVEALDADARYVHRWRSMRPEDRQAGVFVGDALYVVPA